MSEIKRIAVLTSGGDAPGMNAAIRAVVRTALHKDLRIYGVRRGYKGLIEGDIFEMSSGNVGNIIHRGGTYLKTARSMEFHEPEYRQRAYARLRAERIDALIVIGGNGTFTGAQKFGSEFNIPIIGIPGTIDNDLVGTDFSIGYDTAVNTAIEAVDKIRDTADSHNRLFFVEVMGRNSGMLALNTGIGSGAGSILIPEIDKQVDGLMAQLQIGLDRKKLFSLVIVAEGNKGGDAMEIAEKVKAKLKDIPDSYDDIKVAIIGHLQRGGSPTAADRVLASRLGYAAVEGILEGRTGVMVGVVANEIKFTPLEESIANLKAPNEHLMKMAEILSS